MSLSWRPRRIFSSRPIFGLAPAASENYRLIVTDNRPKTKERNFSGADSRRNLLDVLLSRAEESVSLFTSIASALEAVPNSTKYPPQLRRGFRKLAADFCKRLVLLRFGFVHLLDLRVKRYNPVLVERSPVVVVSCGGLYLLVRPRMASCNFTNSEGGFLGVLSRQ